MKLNKIALILAILLVVPVGVLGQTTISPTITSPVAGASFDVGQAVNFQASATGGSSPYSFTWNFGDGTAAFGSSHSKTYTTAGTFTVELTASDFNGVSNTVTRSISITNPLVNNPLTATITTPANNADLNVGQAVNFQASATGGSSPYSFTWNFGDGTAAFGSSHSKTYTTAGTFTVELTASDFEGVVDSKSITVNVIEQSNPTPSIDLKANNQDGTLTVTVNTPVTLTWSSQNVTVCTASGSWTGSRSLGSSEVVTPTTAGSRTYTLTCTDADNATVSDSVTVVATDDSVPPPSSPAVDLKANNQDGTLTVTVNTPVTLTWSSQNVATCDASGAWTGSRSLGSSETITPTTAGSRAYTLTCTGANNATVSDSVTVVATDDSVPPGGSLTISNVRVTDVTTNRVTVRWTTNRAATSRVIYDTASRSISGQTAPNFGYAFSTETFDEDNRVIEHSVTVTGLSANTTYFFRAISQE